MYNSRMYVCNDINENNIDKVSKVYMESSVIQEGKFKNPGYDDVIKLNAEIESLGSISEEEEVARLFRISKDDSAKISRELKDKIVRLSPNIKTANNLYMKVVYWAQGIFRQAICDRDKWVYICGEMTKHEILMAYILCQLGIKVCIVDKGFNREKYLDYREYCEIEEFSHIENLSVRTTTKIDINNLGIILKDGEKHRFGSLVYIAGCNRELSNTLIELGNKMHHALKIERNGVRNPSNNDIKNIEPIRRLENTSRNIDLMYKVLKDTLGDKGVETVEGLVGRERNSTKIFNQATLLLYFNSLYSSFDRIVVYGEITKGVVGYFKYAASIGKKIVYIDPVKTCGSMIDKDWQVENLNMLGEPEYPNRIIVETTAKIAESSIRDKIYTPGMVNLGIYGSQDNISNSIECITLDTTIDEISILINEEARVRPGFRAEGSTVYVPVVYVNIIGYNEDIICSILDKVVEHSIVYNSITDMSNGLRAFEYSQFRKGAYRGKQIVYVDDERRNFILDREAFRSSGIYLYSNIPEEKQVIMENAIQKLLGEYEYAGGKGWDGVGKIISAAAKLNERMLEYIVWQEYNKISPKLVVINTDKSIMDDIESYVIKLLHLVGWDIVFITPTCYSISKIINNKEYREYRIGEANFNVNIENLRNTIDKKKMGILERIGRFICE